MVVEGEGADVALFVGRFFFEALFELPVLLEPVSLCHGGQLFLGLHHTSLASEGFQLAFEDGVFAELAFQRTVVEREFDGRPESYLFEAFLPVAEHPCLVAHERMLELLADDAVGLQQVGCRDALSVRRIGHHDAFLCRLCEVLDVGLLDGDVLRQSGGPDIQTCGVDALHVDVVAVDMVLELTFA